jgi:release factor glutamine methyltransferase
MSLRIRPISIQAALLEASAQLTGDHARRDAETLLAHILTRDRAWLLAHSDDPLSTENLETLRALTARRAAHEPLQHLTGQQEFYGLTLRVTPDTLIPRPETELLVEAVINAIPNKSAPIKILDVGTGTGAITLALAAHLLQAEIFACDVSEAALAVARENARRLDLDHRISFMISDLLAALAGEIFDIIVSNPPYVSLADASTLAPEVRDHEPHLALFAGADGLGIYRRLIPAAHAALVPNGLLALEIGFGQSASVRALLDEKLWHSIRILNDYAAIPRLVLATRY